MSEVYTQDDNCVLIDHVDRNKWILTCSCGRWSDRAYSETQATNLAMDHVLEHDIAYETSLEDSEEY